MDHRYRDAAVRYLVFLAAACSVASIHTGGAVMAFVWVVTAIGMGLFGKALTGKNSSKPRCKH